MAGIAARYSLGSPETEKLERLAWLLSTPEAPTAAQQPRQIRDDHLADALVALELDEVRSARVIADIGAGPGVPGLPLAIALPDAHVSLVESNTRKCAFIAEAIRVCELVNATIVNARAEEWQEGFGRCDLVTARAVAALSIVAEYAAPLLREGGCLVAWRGGIDPSEETAAAAAAGELGLRYAGPLPVVPYPGALNRHLQSLVKIAPTPSRFPRRPGIARKRPLGTSSA